MKCIMEARSGRGGEGKEKKEKGGEQNKVETRLSSIFAYAP